MGDVVNIRPTLRSVTSAALDSMPWLTVTDAPLRAVALRLAEQIDRAEERADTYRTVQRADPLYHLPRALEAWCDVTRTVADLAPKLTTVLEKLGGTPAARRELDSQEPEGDLIEELRVVR